MRRAILASFVLLFTAVSSFAAHFVYSPEKALTDSDRAELASRGLVVERVLAGGRYLVKGAAATESIEGLEPLTPERKLLRTAVREIAKGNPVARVRVMFHEDVTFDQAEQAVLAAGATFADPLERKLGVMQQIDVLVPSPAVNALASDDRVFVIAGAPLTKVRSDNSVTAALSHVTELYSAPYELSGAGVQASLFELAEGQATHPEFGGRLTVNATGGATADRQHATHVAGTIGAAGIDPLAKGMAPKVTLSQFRASGTVSQWMNLKNDSLGTLGSVADNNSWGYVLGWETEGSDHVWGFLDIFFGAYDLVYTAPIDKISREKNVLFVHSAGNEADLPSLNQVGAHKHTDDDGNTITNEIFCYSADGSGNDCPTPQCTAGPDHCEAQRHMPKAPFDTIGLTASGKNSIAVGAVDDLKSIASFSGRGPAKDGRVKPDLVARGVNVFSLSTNSLYSRKSGTSMAAPAVTGMSVLLTEQWRKTFGGASPNPAQLKALLIAGADDLGNTGPDYTFGYGLANAKASVDLIRADAGQGNRIRNGNVATSDRFEFGVKITDAQKLRVNLQWLDPEIAYLGDEEEEIAEKALVNDLDLVVIDPNGDTVLPWVLNPNNPSQTASRGVNTRDNSEVVEVANANSGIYRVTVVGRSIIDRSPQAFTVVANAQVTAACVDNFELNNTASAPYGDLAPARAMAASLCSPGDVDHFKFSVTKPGDVSIVVNATGDTQVRATATRSGQSSTVDVPAGASRTITFNVAVASNAQPVAVVVKFETIGNTIGNAPSYTFTPAFGQTTPPRTRSVHK